jgi:adenine/guanine phosphoribosyltransferase-like PRPP-binding protein
MGELWDGKWVADTLGVQLRGVPDATDETIRDYVGLALRRNTKRSHLLVSHVLGKHIPADPRAVRTAGLGLGELVGAVLDEHGGPAPLVIGFAETATGLGHSVADQLDAPYLHSTRRHVPGSRAPIGFTEEHSHATGHLLLLEDDSLLTDARAVVLVDDELSTGRTAANTIRALHASCPRELYIVASLVDVRDPAGHTDLARLDGELGARIVSVPACRASITLPGDLGARAAETIASLAGGRAPEPSPDVPKLPANPRAAVSFLRGLWPAGVREGGRHGFDRADRVRLAEAVDPVVRGFDGRGLGDRVLVLGFEELMHAPLLIALGLADGAGDGQSVRFSSTTRSPVLAVDHPGYAIRTALSFPAHDAPADGPGPRYAYNVAPADGAEAFTDIVLVIDDAADTAELHAGDGLLAGLTGVCDRLHVVVLPAYRPAL